MSGKSQPFEIVEIDMDYCSRTFGVGLCTASLAGPVVRKCFNTFYTCRKVSVYDKSALTYRFVQPRPNYPKGATVFPLLVSTSGRSATVNIAGSDPRMESLGQRGTVTASFIDTVYHDRFVDKYAAGRVDGTAQTDEGGYNPQDRGTFWTKFKARNPNYAGRPMRVITAYLDGDVITVLATRNFVISEMEGPDNNGNVTIKGKDILFLADNDKAVAPKQSRGQLIAGITADVGQVFTLNPVSVGAEYSASGFGTVGSELVQFTRSGDVVSLTARGLNGTIASTHAVNDTFQQSYSPRLKRIDDVIYELLVTYAGINPAYISLPTWQNEINRWAPYLSLTTDILKPTGVNDLIGELAILGVSIWWDEVSQLIGLKVNRPPDTDVVKSITDFANIIEVKQEDRDADRLTEVLFNTIVIDPTKSITDSANYLRGFYLADAAAKSPLAYGDTKIKEINCRWLNHGNDALVKILSKRLLNRFNRQPVRYEIDLDINDDVKLTDVINMQSYVISDETGLGRSQLMQVISREDIKQGHQLRIVTQSFAFNQRYGYITENTRPVYGSSSAAQKARGAYFSDATLFFSDGLGAYRFI